MIHLWVREPQPWLQKKLGRKYFGIEKDKKYFGAAYKRINNTKIIKDNYLDTVENNKSKLRDAIWIFNRNGCYKTRICII